jgi:hypothetical protein
MMAGARFNGAAVLPPRRDRRDQPAQQVPLQASMVPRSYDRGEDLEREGRSHGHVEASMVPRSYDRGEMPRTAAPTSEFQTLQWCRSLTTAESANVTGFNAPAFLASMVPRSYDRGEGHTATCSMSMNGFDDCERDSYLSRHLSETRDFIS